MLEEIRQSAFSPSDKQEFTSHSQEYVAVSPAEKEVSRRLGADLSRGSALRRSLEFPFCFGAGIVRKVTTLLERLLATALNCCVSKSATPQGFGVTVIDGVAAINVTVAVPDFVVSAYDVAWIVTCDGLGATPGAL